jgi:hypothetical protein
MSFQGGCRTNEKAKHSVTRYTHRCSRRLPDTKAPAHLNGTLPGDSGFDPLGLGQDENRLKW